MSKTKLILAFVTLAILIVSVVACAAPAAPSTPAATEPAKPAATEPAATEPAATEPAATEPAATEPAATAPAAAIKTSYAAKTYTNDEYGFSFQYPDTMAAADPTAKYGVFSAAEPMAVPAVSASVLDTAKLEDQTKESLESAGGSDVSTVSTTDITLADGKTKGTLSELAWKSSGYDITTFSISVDVKDGKTVSVSYTSLKDMIDAKVAKEVVNTLVVK